MFFRIFAKAVLPIMLAVLPACAVTAMKAYPGPVLPASQTARVESGAYTAIEALDAQKVTSETMDVLPGPHILLVRPLEYRQPAGPYWFSSPVTASVEFAAQAGHIYVAYVDFVVASGPAAEEKGSGFRWIGSILDRTADRIVGKTDPLPLEARPRIPPILRATRILGIEQ